MNQQNAQPHPVIAACANARDEAALAPYTVRTAIADARRLRHCPEAVLDTACAKRTIDTLLAAIESSTCFLKAVQKGEQVFVLRESDRAAPETIEKWADIAQAHGCGAEKVLDARRTAVAWAAHDIAFTKWPD